jgi:hypothetical protein
MTVVIHNLLQKRTLHFAFCRLHFMSVKLIAYIIILLAPNQVRILWFHVDSFTKFSYYYHITMYRKYVKTVYGRPAVIQT